MFRDPIKNIVSILSMVSGMPKWIVRKFQGMLKEKMIGGLCPENMTKAKAIADIEIGLKVGDPQKLVILKVGNT